MGGVGKTTLARQYGESPPSSFVWEINAETKDTLMESFENLAQSLALSEEDKKQVLKIGELPSFKERQTTFLLFIKGKLNKMAGWLLLYDNVESFKDIKNSFPTDEKNWGQGKVILTTRDSNISNNLFVKKALKVEDLTPQECFDLFLMILSKGKEKKLMPLEITETKRFVQNLPPFPLDISTAAYYINATHIDYETYLNYLKEQNKEFTIVQETVIREASDYTKTREAIITLSLKRLVEAHKEFGGLFLFISLLDSQNIPRKLLNTYRENAIIDNFLYHVQKYSLINSSSTSVTPVQEQNFSIHRSTQEIASRYLARNLQKETTAVSDIMS